MTNSEQKANAKKFVAFWKEKIKELNKGNERSYCQSFWISLLRDVFGVDKPEQMLVFEEKVRMDEGNSGFVDVRIPTTKVLIEQKSSNKDLRATIKQSDGESLNSWQQAKRYIANLPLSKHPRWVITSNFKTFLIYDMENPTGEPDEILLESLTTEFYRLQFLVDEGNKYLKKEMEVSIQAGELVGKLYDEIYKQYKEPENEKSQKSLNMLCVRLVFCLYAEDSGLFGRRNMFHDYLARFEAKDLRRALMDLFRVLNQKNEERDPYEDELSQFPYVNGGLFADQDIEIPNLTEKVKEILLQNASEDFDWSQISPTIFGAVFESTLNPVTRRKGGMHYTSIENIHKVIDPLFLDELTEEFEEIKKIPVDKTREKKLKEFQKKLSSLVFLDPACGSGNFLTETYLSLRKLENKIIEELIGAQITLGYEASPIQISINQFYGIEINDFAVTVATTALWIAESQMMKKTEEIVHANLEFLPLKSYVNIIEGNALRVDWNTIVNKERLTYIMGNPPFVGARLLDEEQRKDVNNVFVDYNNSGNLDYVCCWYKVISDFTKGTNIKTALVSTNSIVEGEAVGLLWKPLFNDGIHIDFAHTSFKWNSEAKEKAQVYCVIIGFSHSTDSKIKMIFSNGKMKNAKNINAYLVDADNIFVERRQEPLCDIPKMHKGCQPTDGGNLIIEEKDYEEFIKKEPKAKEYIKKLIGAKEFLQNKNRYCLWLVGISPSELRSMPLVMDRVKKCKEMRLSAKDKGTQKLAERATEFRETYNYDNYLVVPKLTTLDKRYIPMGFCGKDVISTDLNYITENASLYHFGILQSNVHMAWMRSVCGRMGNAYRYSAGVVYNNFPWVNPTEAQRVKIEKTAQGILDMRLKYSDSTLADLYNDDLMPKDLRDAHRANDRAVMELYGFPVKNEFTESMCVAELMKLYEELVKTKEN